MKAQHNSRTTDLGTTLYDGSTGFQVRKRNGIGMFFHVFALCCMVLMGASLLVYYRSPEGCAFAVAIGLSFALIAQNLEKQKKSRESLEFMNALLSSALGAGHRFCCIVKNTGDIMFYNRPFQEVFPEYITQGTHTLDALFTLYNVPQADHNAITGLMAPNRSGTINTSIRAEGSNTQTISIILEPIERPTGYFLLRGK
ncbi:MAG: hypothetical protein ACOYNL_03550 [Rickettsiales bacterium]